LSYSPLYIHILEQNLEDCSLIRFIERRRSPLAAPA